MTAGLFEEREASEKKAKDDKEKAEREARIDKFFCAALTGLTADHGMGNDRYGHRGVVNMDLINIAWSYAVNAEIARRGKV